MHSEYEKQLEAEIQRQLDGLRELRAPDTLLARVMSQVGTHAELPWYRQPWLMWPQLVRVVTFVLLLVVFGTLCFASWKLTQAESVVASAERLGGWFAAIGAVWNALNALLNVIVLLLKQLGTGFLVGCLVAMTLGYALCLGLGTIYVRLAFARR
jgi:hypothetical protein